MEVAKTERDRDDFNSLSAELLSFHLLPLQGELTTVGKVDKV